MRSLIRATLRQLHLRQVPESFNSINILRSQCFGKVQKITPYRVKKFKRLAKLRSFHVPIQYLCDSWPFRQLDLKLKLPVLIPRYQSQYMIQLLLPFIRAMFTQAEMPYLKFIQYGCGSGALGLSLAKQLNIKGKLLDINRKCVQLSRLNAIRNQIILQHIQFIEGDMKEHLNYILTQDIVISNPPYLSIAHYQKYLKHQIKRYEDKNSLVAQEDGMQFINMILQFWKQRTKKGILILQYDGREFGRDQVWIEPYVRYDQYNKRRFILMQK